MKYYKKNNLRKGQILKIPIGTIRESLQLSFGETAHYYHRYYGFMNVVGRIGQGKSGVTKDILVRLFNQTGINTFIFDVNGEWKDSIFKHSFNDRSERIKRKYVKIIEEPRLRLTDMKNSEDFYYLCGISGKFVDIYLDLIYEMYDYHENNPKKFSELLNEIPSTKAECEEWNLKYGSDLTFNKPFHRETLNSAVNNFPESYFVDPNCCDNEYIYVTDILDYIKDYSILLFNANTYDEERGQVDWRYIGFIYGKIMEMLEPYLYSMKPLMIFEESSYLFSNDENNKYKSTDMGILYVTKFRKRNVHCWFISQSFSQIHSQIIGLCDQRIIFKMSDTDRALGLADKNRFLKYNLDIGEREAIYMDINKHNYYRYFTPYDACCKV